MSMPRNEVDAADPTDFEARPPMGFVFVALTALHVLCCGLPLLLLSGVSLATIFPSWPVIGVVLAMLGVVGFVWYLRKGCASCPGNPKRCRPRHSELSESHKEIG